MFGTLGTPAAGNIPGATLSASSWTDGSGNFWLFGGIGNTVSGNNYIGGDLNVLWEFSHSTNEWTWMGGTGIVGQPGVYGILGTPAAANFPGARDSAAAWTDKSEDFWLFSGNGMNSNDLWKFSPATLQWTWTGGNNTSLQRSAAISIMVN
jgi:hypothetical protein